MIHSKKLHMLNLYENYKYLKSMVGFNFSSFLAEPNHGYTVPSNLNPMKLENITFSSLKCLIIKLGTKVIKSIDENCKFMINLG